MELLPPQLSSPTISSISSSSDLDTESTGSFFHDRSQTLGTLMGVTTTFPTITFRAPSRCDATPTVTLGSRRRRINTEEAPEQISERKRKRLRRRKWWWLCNGDEMKPSSLGEFLEVERRFGEEAVFDIGGGGGGEGVLFADGRVLPPVGRGECGGEEDEMSSVCLKCRFSVSFARRICNGGGGG